MVQKVNTWVVYPGTFGGFNGLAEVLPNLKKLGINQIHILPFYEATGDDGFEVVNYNLKRPLKIAAKWGGEKEFSQLISLTKKLGISLMADAVLNHISGRSPVLAKEGLEELCLSWDRRRLPFKFLRLESGSDGGVMAVYWHCHHQVKQMVIFPEQADSKQPHLVQVGNRWVWHTFYPNQFDLDLNRPAAFTLAKNTLEQISGWLGGRGTIRLDAIPFVGKVINRNKFEFNGSRGGREIISRLRRVLADKAPGITLLAEASGPVKQISDYASLVGGNYDFSNFPRFIAAAASEDAGELINSVNRMIKTIGLPAMEQLAFTVQTHDDIPLAELGEAKLTKRVWRELKQKGALAFGTKKSGDLPKGAVIRLMDVCGGNAKKLAAMMFLAAMMPHGRLLFLYGTEIGLKLGAIQPPDPGLQPDARTAIRGPLAVDDYLRSVRSPLAKNIGKILKMRLEQLPDRYDFWKATTQGTRVMIEFSGGRARVNLAYPYDYELENSNSRH